MSTLKIGVKSLSVGLAGVGPYGSELDLAQKAKAELVCLHRDAYKGFDPVKSPVCCIDDRLDGGLAGGALTLALMMNYLYGGNFIYNLALVHRKMPVLLHEDCAALANCVNAVRLLADVNSPVYSLYDELYDGVIVGEETRELVAVWAASMPENYINVPEALSYVRALQHGSVVSPPGVHQANSAVFNELRGRIFTAHEAFGAAVGGRPFVVNAWLPDKSAAVLADDHSAAERFRVAFVGQLFTLAVLSQLGSQDMEVFRVERRG